MNHQHQYQYQYQHQHPEHSDSVQQQLLRASQVVLFTSDNTLRSDASRYLEEWIHHCSWNDWVEWWRYLLQLHLHQSSAATTTTAGAISEQEFISMRLLCLHLLQTKIRKQITKDYLQGTGLTSCPPEVISVQSELLAYLFDVAAHPATTASTTNVASTACICVGAISVRSCNSVAVGGGQRSCPSPSMIGDLISRLSCTISSNESVAGIAFKLLGNIAVEVQGCGWYTPAQVQGVLGPYVDTVLGTMRQFYETISTSNAVGGVPSSNVLLRTAFEALRHWITVVPISVVELQRTQILDIFVRTLSVRSSNHEHQQVHQQDDAEEERVIVEASRSLTQAISVQTQPFASTAMGSMTRQQTLRHLILHSIPTNGFIALRYHQALKEGFDDAALELAVLLSTLVCDCIENEDADGTTLLNHEFPISLWALLQQMQLDNTTPSSSSSFKVRRAILDIWLTIQEIPTSERHVSYREALFKQLVPILVQSIVYSEDYEDDEDDWKDYRSAVQDVFVSSYYLLRMKFVQQLASVAVGGAHAPGQAATNWCTQEAAIFALNAAAREICSRVYDAKIVTVRPDQQATCQTFFSLVHQLINSMNAAACHPILIESVVRFVGAYAPAWETVFKACSSDAASTEATTSNSILQLLHFLQQIMGATQRTVGNNHQSNNDEYAPSVVCARSIQSILLGCSKALLRFQQEESSPQALVSMLHQIFQAATATENEHTMVQVAQGCTRLIIQIKDESIRRQALAMFTHPVLQGGDTALQVATVASSGSIAAVSNDTVVRGIESVVRYLAVLQVVIRFGSDGDHNTLTEVLTPMWQFLEKVSQQNIPSQDLLEKIIVVQEQLLKNVPALMAPHLSATIQYVVEIFQNHKIPTALSYMTRAVEQFGAAHIQEFQGLLDHVSIGLFSYITSVPVEESTEVVAAFFELCQRYVLYCPAALIACRQFSGIVSCAVEYVAANKGERGSTRAVLIFVSQLFGWRSLRLSAEAQSHFQSNSRGLDELLLQHGDKLCGSCIATLLNGAQALGPACTDCLLAVLTPAATWGVPENADSSVGRQWLEAAKPGNCNDQIFNQVISLLMDLVQNDNPKIKARAKMLLMDFCHIQKGEMAADSLASYS